MLKKLIAKKKMNNILKIYRKMGKEILNEDIEVEWCSDFACLPYYPYKVFIGMLISEKNKKELPLHYKNNYICKFSVDKIEIYVLNFIHELGHIVTDFEFSDDDKKYDKDIITLEEYRKLPHEWAADDWAVEYINNNGFKIFQWQRKLQTAYSKITQKDLEIFIKYFKNNS